MKILHLNAGNETGGGMFHIIDLLEQLTGDERFNVTLGLFEKKELYHLADEKNITTVHFPNKTKYSPLLLKRLLHFIKEEGISIVHTHGPRANSYVKAIRKQVPFYWITTVHSDPQFDFKERAIVGKVMYKLHIDAIKEADHIITVCDAFEPSLERAHVEANKITTILNGLSFNESHNEAKDNRLREKFGFCDEVFLCLQVARLERVKGHDISLRAFAKFKEHVKNCHLLIVGDGSLKRELQLLAKKLKINKDITFFGERKDVDLFYNMADVTLLSSFSEGFPLVLLESARAKTPIISTDVGGIRHLITNAELGWRIKPNCIQSMVKALSEAHRFKENNTLTSIGKNLYHYASGRFSVENFAQKVYNIYLDANIDELKI